MHRPGHCKTILTLTILLAAGSATLRQANAYDISPAGARLAAYYDSLDVEHHWLPGEKISWRSGDPSPKGGNGATHCSAFVASACAGLDVYILRPPEHKQTHLANAQFEWLAAAGKEKGWRPVATPAEAQQRANRGELVVAAYRNPDDTKPGHIALVRPSLKSNSAIASEGPDVIQAGGHNRNRVALKSGFGNHPGAWQNHEVRFYAHPTE